MGGLTSATPLMYSACPDTKPGWDGGGFCVLLLLEPDDMMSLGLEFFDVDL